MSSDTLAAKVPAVPHIPEPADAADPLEPVVGLTPHEAAQAPGPSRWRRRRRIVLPQAMRSLVPPAGNMLTGALKGTSIVSVIAVLGVGQDHMEQHYARGSERAR